jgi:hypothetical protein
MTSTASTLMRCLTTGCGTRSVSTIMRMCRLKDCGMCAEEKGANMTICYDGDFPELPRVLTVKGTEVIVRPSALLRSFEI